MRISRFYIPLALNVGETIVLPDSAFRHAIQVLRLKPGARLILFNGAGGEFQAILEQVERRQATALVEAFIPHETESTLAVTLIQAVSKGERMDYTLQKAVELGVHHIVPVISARSVVNLSKERLQKRLSHWQGVIISACEQCGRNRLPTLHEPIALSDYLSETGNNSLNLLLNPDAERSLKALPPAAGQDIRLLIGPEGGFTGDEIELSEQAGFIGIRLGPRVLRTETAGIVALAALQTLWGDLCQ